MCAMKTSNVDICEAFTDYFSVANKMSEICSPSSGVDIDWQNVLSFEFSNSDGEFTKVMSIDELVSDLELSQKSIENYAMIDLFLSNKLGELMSPEALENYTRWEHFDAGIKVYNGSDVIEVVSLGDIKWKFRNSCGEDWTFESCFKSLNGLD
ncbi:hypothetical protein VCHA53O466_40048 [Vibrio chagasii]|nr:hypothetical protein VCHA53O466_40048 [Vibrio chagasii]